MRFFSSSALARAPKLRLAASCSAAETMFGFLPRLYRCHVPRRRHIQQTPDINLVLGFRKIHRPGMPDRPLEPAMTQMLRSFAFVFLRWRQDFHRAAGLLDRRDGGFRRAVNLDRQLGLDLAAAEQAHAGLGAADRAGFHQRFGVDGALGIERLGIDRPLNPVEIDFGEFEPENIGEAALGQTPMQRHLAAFKALDAHAGARGLALAAAAGGLALAGANATADPHALLARAGIVGDIAELHRSLPLSLEHDLDRKPVPTFRDHAPILFLVDDADEVLNLCDHAANSRRVPKLGDP